MGSKIQMLTGRTAKYVEAMIREGDNFDYSRWLQRVREEEARVKSVAASTSVQPIVAEPNHHAKIAQNPSQLSDSGATDEEHHKLAVQQVIRGVCHGTKSVDKPKK